MKKQENIIDFRKDGTMKKLFKNKNYVLLFQGSLVSLIGTMIYSFAAGIYVLSLFPVESYGNIGALYFALISAAPIITKLIVSPLSGALVDKWNRIRIIYLTDFINGAIFFISLYLLVNGNFTIYQQVILFTIVGGLAGINSAFFSPAVQSSIPDIVGEELIQTAYGAQQIIYSIQGIVGVLIGVILYEMFTGQLPFDSGKPKKDELLYVTIRQNIFIRL